MFKKSIVTVAAAVVLAACSSVPAPYTEDGEYVTGVRTGSSVTPTVLSSDPALADNVHAFSREDVRGLGSLQQDLVATAADRVQFEFDSASLTPQAQESLKRVAAFIKQHSARINTVTIEGHADERGTREYNLALGERRAVSIKRYLVGLGIDADTIKTISFGKERPVDTRHTEDAWRANRRGVIVLR